MKEFPLGKRNHAMLRRRRHARNLHRIFRDAIEQAERSKPTDDTVLRGCHRYGVGQERQRTAAIALVELATKKTVLRTRTDYTHVAIARAYAACCAVDVLPVAIQVQVRGRALGQIDKDLAENRNYIKHRELK